MSSGPRSAITAVLFTALSVVAADPAQAEDEFDIDWRVHATVTATGGLAWIASEALWKDRLAPDECRWCGTVSFDATMRTGLLWDQPDSAHRLSNLVGFGIAPLSAFGLTAAVASADDELGQWPIDSLLILESAVLAADLNQLVKMSVGRARSFTLESGSEGNPDDMLSFYSGHTSLAFSLAVSSGTVASIRGYRAAPLVWVVGMGAAATTGYLRIAADKHFATDVLVGAALGSAIGLAVPLLAHRGAGSDRDLRITAAPVEGGAVAGLGFRW